jgi:threonine/homoserine/homoserine lactone efflux protein
MDPSTLTNYPAYLAATALIIAAPGPVFLFVLGLGSASGRGQALSAVLGIVSGTTCHAVLAVVGLTVAIAASQQLFQVVQVVGAGYTLYLGFKLLRGKFKPIAAAGPSAGASSMRKPYLDGLLTQLLNPKPAIFFLSFMPQFVAPGHARDPVVWLALASAPILFGLLWYGTVALFSSAVGGFFAGGGLRYVLLRKLPGAILVAISLYVFASVLAQFRT